MPDRLKKIASGVYAKTTRQTKVPAAQCVVGLLFKQLAKRERPTFTKRVDVDGGKLGLLAPLIRISFVMPTEETFIVSLNDRFWARVAYYNGNQNPWNFQYLALAVFCLDSRKNIVPIGVAEYRHCFSDGKVKCSGESVAGFDTNFMFGFGGASHSGECPTADTTQIARDLGGAFAEMDILIRGVTRSVVEAVQGAQNAQIKKKAAKKMEPTTQA